MDSVAPGFELGYEKGVVRGYVPGAGDEDEMGLGGWSHGGEIAVVGLGEG